MIALKELATPETWQPGSAKASLATALAALDEALSEAAFQTVLTHGNIVEIYWANVCIICPHSRQPIAVKWKGVRR